MDVWGKGGWERVRGEMAQGMKGAVGHGGAAGGLKMGRDTAFREPRGKVGAGDGSLLLMKRERAG